MAMSETSKKTLEQVAAESGRYPPEAFDFVRQGLNHTVMQIHGASKAKAEEACHVTGQQLCWGLRNYAVQRYGLMARSVLEHWNITRTNDFGRIVFAMVESKLMQKTDRDDIRDFSGVFDFATAFNSPERPACPPKVVLSL